MNAPARFPAATGGARLVEASLRFGLAGGRTVLVHQHVPYPFHITRPFRLDDARPDLATLYLQSSAGGLYRDDFLSLGIATGKGAAAHVTTQASTIVHDASGGLTRLHTGIDVEDDAQFAYTPDPMILMPGARYEGVSEVVLSPGAVAVVADGFLAHDPTGGGRRFEELVLETHVGTRDGRRLVTDRLRLEGRHFDTPASPLGRYRAYGQLLMVSAGPDPLTFPPDLMAKLDALGIFAGASPLPNGAGVGLRLLAEDGGRLGQGFAEAAQAALAAVFQIDPAPRRK